MSKPFSPDISCYEELLPFFEDFYSINKEKNKKFSYQYLANKLGWSAPYLNDIFKGRKRLSLNRAMEFIQLLELKGMAAERFLILYLADSDADFAKSPLKSSTLAATNANLRPSTDSLERSIAQTANVFEHYICFYIFFHKGVWDPQDFLSRLTLTTKPSLETLEKFLRKLIKIRRLIYDPETQLYTLNNNDHELLHLDQSKPNQEELRQQVTRYAKEHGATFLDYLENPIFGKAGYVVGLVTLNEEMYQEVRTRMVALHNYLIEISQKAVAEFETDKDSATGVDSRVWQYQLNLFSVFENKEIASNLK